MKTAYTNSSYGIHPKM